MAMTARTVDDAASTLFPRHRFTVDEYYKLAEAGILTEDDRVELIEGDVVEMTPITPGPAETVDVSADALWVRLENRARVRVQNPAYLNRNTERQPDLTACALREYLDSHPTPADIFLIVEVADSKLERERANGTTQTPTVAGPASGCRGKPSGRRRRAARTAANIRGESSRTRRVRIPARASWARPPRSARILAT